MRHGVLLAVVKICPMYDRAFKVAPQAGMLFAAGFG